MHAPRPGDLLARRYQLIDLLVEKDGGRFWRAYDQMLERDVALHLIDAVDPRAAGLREAARRSATVADPHLLRVLDTDVVDGVCYVVNEYGWGASLDVVVAGAGPLGPRRAAWLVAEVAGAVAAAHARGVSHGRLIPENILIDRAGGVVVIGLAVDAALHGLPPDRRRSDVADLAGLLYCALTGLWAGPTPSLVPRAPHEHDVPLRPRRVRAGVPRPLDVLCDDLLNPRAGLRSRDQTERTAEAVAATLLDFVGDPTGLPEALVASVPDVLPEATYVVLPPVPEFAVQLEDPMVSMDVAATPTPTLRGSDPEASLSIDDGIEGADEPTAAGLPIFGDDDDVSWWEKRTEVPPPPPPFEEPPERPLFAPDPPAGRAPRRPRTVAGTGAGAGAEAGAGAAAGRDPASTTSEAGSGFWPWEVEEPAARLADSGTDRPDDGPRPGRRRAGRRRADTAPEPVATAPAGTAGAVGPRIGTRSVGSASPVGPGGSGSSGSSVGSGGSVAPRPRTGIRGWEAHHDPQTDSTMIPVVDDHVPGRRILRIAYALVLAVVLIVVVIVAVNIGRGKTALGADRGAGAGTGAGHGATAREAAATAPGPVLAVAAATALDPEGDGEEHDDQTALAVDGDPATAWTTQSYVQQLGPGGLKDGVGLTLDLGSLRRVGSVELRLDPGTSVQLFVTASRPSTIAGLMPAASGTATATRLTLTPTTAATPATPATPATDAPDSRGRWVTVWLTALPRVGSIYRGTLAQVVVRGP